MIADDEVLTARRWMRELYGAVWLGNATLDEYAAATYFESENVSYMYQAPVAGFANDLWVDFQLLITPRIYVEIMGDKWHQGNDQIAIDRGRIIQIEDQTGIPVIQVWGSSLMHYNGHPYPTGASYKRVMAAAVMGIEISSST